MGLDNDPELGQGANDSDEVSSPGAQFRFRRYRLNWK